VVGRLRLPRRARGLSRLDAGAAARGRRPRAPHRADRGRRSERVGGVRRDPVWRCVHRGRQGVGNSAKQIDAAIAFKATTIVALDFLFWDVYGSPDPAWRDHALAAGLAQLERARSTGSWVIVGDIPHIVTAAEWMLPSSQVPDATSLAALNAKIVAWTQGKDRVLFVPFASWAEPLAAGGEIEIAPGEKVPATSLVAVDGLHANALGVWTLLDRLDRLIETTLPGTPKDALVFVRPTI
jgi:hypothetical protein